MKKTLLYILSALILLAAIGTLLVLRELGITNPATLAPANATLFVSVPDLPRTAIRWHQTSLHKISTEKDVAAFLKKPLSTFGNSTEGQEITELLTKLRPGRIFFAAIAQPELSFKTLLGFQFWGGDQAFNQLTERIKKETASQTTPEPNTPSHQGSPIHTFILKDGEPIFSASAGRWGFFSNDLDLLRETLDRTKGRATTPSLEKDPAYLNTISKLDRSPDLAVFLRVQPLLTSLLDAGTQFGLAINTDQLRDFQQITQAGYSIRLDRSVIRDSFFFDLPEKNPSPSLQRPLLQITQPTTLAFIQASFMPDEIIEALQNLSLIEPSNEIITEIAHRLSQSPGFLGKLAATALDWNPEQGLPKISAAVEISDPKLAAQLLNDLSHLAPDLTKSNDQGIEIHKLPNRLMGLYDIHLALANSFATLSTDRTQLTQILKDPSPQQSLAANPAFQSVKSDLLAANQLFVFLDSKAAFEKGYPFLKQILSFAAILNANLNQLIEPDKLPATESIAKHLTPLVYSQSADKKGTLIRSYGPIPLSHAVGLITTSLGLQKGLLGQ